MALLLMSAPMMVLQCVAVWCSVGCRVGLVEPHASDGIIINVGSHDGVAVCCSVLQCVAVCCSVLQCVAVCCSALPILFTHTLSPSSKPSSTLTHRNTHIHPPTATHSTTLTHHNIHFHLPSPHIITQPTCNDQRTRDELALIYAEHECAQVCWSVLKCVAVCCRVMQSAAQLGLSSLHYMQRV